MKNILKINVVLVLLLSLFASGCNDFLGKDPENVVPKDAVDYADKNLMFAPVSAVYSRFGDLMTSWSVYSLFVIKDDHLEKGLGSESNQGELLEFKRFEHQNAPTFWMVEATWAYLTEIIMVSNSALEALDKFAANLTDEADLKLNLQYKAEVRFLRAYTYFFMSRLWGDIPVFSNNLEYAKIYRTPHEEVCRYLINELSEAVADLPELTPAQMPHKGSATRYSALALQAKVASDINDMETVFSATEKIITDDKFSLYDDFYQLFKRNALLSCENLFELQFTDFGDPSGVNDKVGGYAQNVQGPSDFLDENGVSMAGGWEMLPPSESLEAKMIARGETIRYTTTILYSGSGQAVPDGYYNYGSEEYPDLWPYMLTPSGDKIISWYDIPMFNGKVYVPSDQLIEGKRYWGCFNNVRMIRYADILLLNAEARVKKGLSGDTPFNLVRTRAGFATLSGVTLQQIYDEREMELALEWGERYYDLVRTGRAASILNGYSDAVKYYPLPRSQTDLNPNLAK